MSQTVSLVIKTTIKHVDGALEENIYKTEGDLYIKSQEIYLRYKEHPDLGNTWSIMKWQKEEKPPFKVTVIRQGDVRANQVFKEGFIDKTLYHSLHGSLDLEIKTTKVAISIEKLEEGTINFEYKLKVNGQLIGDYILSIYVLPNELTK